MVLLLLFELLVLLSDFILIVANLVDKACDCVSIESCFLEFPVLDCFHDVIVLVDITLRMQVICHFVENLEFRIDENAKRWKPRIKSPIMSPKYYCSWAHTSPTVNAIWIDCSCGPKRCKPDPLGNDASLPRCTWSRNDFWVNNAGLKNKLNLWFVTT